jgi:hypothetical protein
MLVLLDPVQLAHQANGVVERLYHGECKLKLNGRWRGTQSALTDGPNLLKG